MSFGCEKLGCGLEAVAGTGKCKVHLRDEVLARRAEKPEGEISLPPPLEKGEDNPARTCPCGEELTPRARSTRCDKCRRKEAQQKYLAKKKEKKGAPSPHAPPIEGGEKKAGDIDPEMVAADMIHHPPHYTRGRIEVIDFIEDNKGLGYHDGNVVKYICRHRHKGAPLADLKKARWYLDRLIEREEAEHGA